MQVEADLHKFDRAKVAASMLCEAVSACKKMHMSGLQIASHIAWHTVDGELALFDRRDGSYHALNSSAAGIWRGLARGESLAAIADLLSKTSGIAVDLATQNVAEFVDLALTKQLLVARNPNA